MGKLRVFHTCYPLSYPTRSALLSFHFTEGEVEAGGISDLPKVRGEAGIHEEGSSLGPEGRGSREATSRRLAGEGPPKGVQVCWWRRAGAWVCAGGLGGSLSP